MTISGREKILGQSWSILLAAIMLGAVPTLAGAQSAPKETLRVTNSQENSSKADAELQSEYAFAIGLQAYFFGLPLVHLDNWRSALIERNPDATVNSFISSGKLFTPATSGGTAPQVDTLYSIGLLALEDGPVVATIPPGIDRYFSVQVTDAYGTNASIMGRREVGSDGAQLFLTGPDFKGTTPDNMQRVTLTTDEGLALVRVFVNDESDLPAAIDVQDRFTLAPTSGHVGAVAAERFKATEGAGEFSFFDRARQLALRNPPGNHLAVNMKSFETIGLDFSSSEENIIDENYQEGLALALVSGPELVA